MNFLNGKNVLLISNSGYSNEMLEELSSLGAKSAFVNDKPKEGFLHKFLGRIHFKPYINFILDKYYDSVLNKLKNKRIDYILCIRGEYTTENALKKMRTLFPNARIILYMWDSLQNNKGIENKWYLFDSVVTFDRKDYLNNKNRISFLPLFYCEKEIPQDEENQLYDLSFVGTGHQDRVKIIKKVSDICKEQGISFYSYIYVPHFFVYLYNKVFNRDYKGVHLSDVSFKRLSLGDAYKIYAQSKVVLDIESYTQVGLTMRTIENIGSKKKLITTNKDIVNYDFYNKNNIMIIDRKNVVIDKSFFDKDFLELPEDIYNKYSLKQWIINVLSM